MRKFFTRSISIFVLISVLVLQGFIQSVVLGPDADFTNHKKTDKFVLTSSEAVVPGTGVVRLKNSSGTALAAYQATNSKVTISSVNGVNTITVDFTSFLQEGATYTLEADANFVKAADDSQPNTAKTWGVTVGDYTAPVLAATNPLTPANNGKNVQLDANLTAKFSEDVEIAEGGMVYIYEANGTEHGDLFDVVEAGSGLSASGETDTDVVTINPNKNFEELTTYYVVIPEGTVVDFNGNKFAGWLNHTTWVFTARDITAPVVTAISKDNVGSTSFDILVQLDKKGKAYILAVPDGVTPSASDFTAANGMKVANVTAASTDVKVSFTQYFDGDGTGANLVEGTRYDIWVITENAEPVSPTQSSPAKKTNVTTTDVTAPALASTDPKYPADDATAADINKKDYMVLVLNENVKIGTGSVNVYTWDNAMNHELVVSVPASSLKIGRVDKDSVYIPVDKTLWESQEDYFVNYTEGVVTDLQGNKLAALTGTSGWNFTVQDFLAPTYTIVPANGTANASEATPQVTITFNETIYANATGTAYTAATIVNPITIKKGTSAVTYTVTSFDGKVLKIDLGTVTSGDKFEVSIDLKEIYDVVGNKGTTVDKISFTIRDFQGPTIQFAPPAPGETDNILVKFNEPVLNSDGTAVTNADVADIVIFRKGNSASGAIVSATYSVSADAKTFIIDPANNFVSGDQYFVRVGAGAVEDAAGNPNSAAETTLTVSDFVLPTATVTPDTDDSPVNPAGLVVKITFSEAMKTLAGDAVTGDATALVTLKENGENIPFTATWNLTGSTPVIEVAATGGYDTDATYTVSVGKSLKDVANNPFNGVSASFTTWSSSAPAVVSKTPAADATQQAVTAGITVTYNQDVVLAGTPDITVKNSSGTNVAGTPSVTGSVLTIPYTALSANETYTVTVATGSIIGENGIATTSATTWSFKTVDTNAPVVDVYSPVVNATGVALDAKLVLTFSENIVEKTGQIFIKDFDTEVTVQTLTEANTVVKENKKLEITLPAALEYGKKYFVVITDGFVEDAVGNDFAGITDATWYFTTATTPGDFVVSTSNPENDEDKIAAGFKPITVTFNRNIKAGSASATAKITLNDGSTNVISDAANTGRFSYNGSTLTINTLEDIVANKTYTLTIDAGIVTDEWNTPNTAKTIVFYTFDKYAPEVASVTPASNAVKVSKGTNITLTWDETPLNAAGGSAISATNVYDIVTISGGVSYVASVSGLEWTLNPDANLSEKTVYTVTVDLTKVEDANGNTGTGTYTWSFTTEDTQINAPTAFNRTETTGTTVKFTVNFDEKGKVYYAVLPGSAAAPTASEIIDGNKSITFASAGTSAVTTVTGLVSGSAYKAYFVAVDEAQNTSTVYAPTAFNTPDVTAPLVESVSPLNNTVDVAADTKLVINFNEAVQKGAGTIIIREVATDVAVASIDITSATVVFSNSNKTATINSFVTLGSKKEYYVEVTAGTFVDMSNNKMAGIYGPDTWSFTTKDTVKPTLVSTVPNHAAANTPEIVASQTLSLTFNEAMKVGTGVVYVRYMDGDEADDVFEVINSDMLSLSADKKTVSFNLTNVPAEEREFYVDLKDIVLSDVADNAWTDVLNTKNWNFIILDQTAPALASSTPDDDATGVAINTNIVLTFTEGIYKAQDGADFTATTIKNVISVKDAAGNAVAYTATLTDVDTEGGVVTVTIDPTSALLSQTVYTVYISPVVDDRNNISSEISISFTTKDDTAPAVAMWNPAYDTQFNPKTGVVTITFTEPIYDEVVTTTEGNDVRVEIVNANIPDFFTYNKISNIVRNDDGDITSYDTGAAVTFTGTISSDAKVITLTPAANQVPLESEAWYSVVLLADMVVDAADNDNLTDETVFRIEDHVKPVVASEVGFAPVGATAVDAAMKITFSEKIAVGSGNIYIRNYVNGEVVETIPVSSTTVTVNNNVATIKHADFPEAMSFFVTADAGTFVDASANANPWNGIATTSINTWKFSTADAMAPGVVTGGLYPAPGSVNVPLTTDLSITFDKKVTANDDDETRWVVIYNEDWTPFQVIEVVDGSNLTISATTEPVLQNGRVVSITHAELEPNSTYYVRVTKGIIVDEAGNVFAGIADDTWMFSTEDDEAPEIVEVTPVDDATNVSTIADLTIEFDRHVLPNVSGMIKLYKEVPGQLGTLVETIDPTSAAVTIVENVATVELSQTLEEQTSYYVIVEASSFTNTSSSKIPLDPGITTTLGWNFTTGDNALYTIAQVQGSAATSPLVGETAVMDTATVTAIVDGQGFFMQDANAAWSGIWVAYAEAAANLEVGDGVKVTGTVAETNGVTTINATTVAVVNAKLTVEAFEVASPSAAQAEMYESVLVVVGGAGTSGMGENNKFEIYYELNDSVVVSNMIYTSPADSVVAGHFFDVTGVVNGTNDAYTLEPRMAADIVDVTKTTPAIIVPGETVNFNVYPNPFNDGINIDNHDKLTRVLITNIAGQRVMDVQYPERRITTSNLVSGVYVISLFTEEGMVKSDRIVKR